MNKLPPFILRPDEHGPIALLTQWLFERDQSKTWQVVVSEYKGSKTQEQLGYYYAAWIPAIQKWLEESRGIYVSQDDLDGYLKDEYLGKKTVVIGDKTKEIAPSIARLNVKEMQGYMDRVDRHCAERGLVLPPPRHPIEE